jgi:hypothetical protein
MKRVCGLVVLGDSASTPSCTVGYTPGVKKSGLLLTIIAPDAGVVRTYGGSVEVADVVDEELDDVVDVDEALEVLVEELVEELVETIDEEDVEVVDVAVLKHEQPLEILEGKPEHAVAQAGRVAEAVAVV